MYETLKEVIEAASNRVRSPILGMIALVYFYLNWKPLFLLMLSDEPAEKRLQLFDQYSDWKNGVLFPIIFGFIL